VFYVTSLKFAVYLASEAVCNKSRPLHARCEICMRFVISRCVHVVCLFVCSFVPTAPLEFCIGYFSTFARRSACFHSSHSYKVIPFSSAPALFVFHSNIPLRKCRNLFVDIYVYRCRSKIERYSPRSIIYLLLQKP
jgi:hypothetical protein